MLRRLRSAGVRDGWMRGCERELNHARLKRHLEIHLRRDRQAAERGIQLAGDREHRIAQFLGGKAAIREVGEEVVVRIVVAQLLDLRDASPPSGRSRDIMMSLCSRLNVQPCSTKSAVSQSSNSGCVGLPPFTPKLFGVLTSGLPK